MVACGNCLRCGLTSSSSAQRLANFQLLPTISQHRLMLRRVSFISGQQDVGQNGVAPGRRAFSRSTLLP